MCSVYAGSRMPIEAEGKLETKRFTVFGPSPFVDALNDNEGRKQFVAGILTVSPEYGGRMLITRL